MNWLSVWDEQDYGVVDYLWREPFNELVNMSKINSGGAGWKAVG